METISEADGALRLPSITSVHERTGIYRLILAFLLFTKAPSGAFMLVDTGRNPTLLGVILIRMKVSFNTIFLLSLYIRLYSDVIAI